ncbi:hypothetical protein GCM10007860_01320 [Chitiniphilus shinanonensis]|uniref:Uncharacterized protein n=1 Tax=Chitiniphilus shinanonensis TaxID=553088 RepID=A0ABQ6BNG0_9NEIS|nr:hypothetical protein [Chitiniphilus shinanonensis]GLS02989.1 hypothetical protein GCM10007860_01320 [Chitiniphilus shinanonensis]
MYSLAYAIGIDRIIAVIDDFLDVASQHPAIAALLSRIPAPLPWRQRLVAFWYATLDGESYRLSNVRTDGAVLFSLVRSNEWQAADDMLRKAIARHVPPYLARQWGQRLDTLGESIPGG